MTPVFLVLAAAALAAAIAASRWAAGWWLGFTLVGLLAALAAAISVLAGGPAWDWRSAAGLGGNPVHLRLDALGAWFLALVAAVGAAGACYSAEYWPDREHPRTARWGRLWWSAELGFMGLILLASDGLHFLIAWELFAVGGYFLVTLERAGTESREAGWLYLAASHAGTLCLFAYFAGLAAKLGTWDLGPLRGRMDCAGFYWLALLGFGIKAGLFPLHIWLPSAHASAPSHVSALLSGLSLKLGIYGILRFSGWFPVPPGAGWTVGGLGALSAVLGVAFALGQHDLKRLLAYHSVENIGIIVMGAGFAMLAASRGDARWGLLALAGGLLHVWNHGLFKSLLFLGAGSVVRATGTRMMSRLGGLWRRMPWTAALFGLGAAAIAGLPPLNGFVSEWLLSLGLLRGMNLPGPGVACAGAFLLLGVTGALALACFTKVCGVAFLGEPRSGEASGARECGPAMRTPMIGLALACAGIGLAPFLLWPTLLRVCAAWNPAWALPVAQDPLVPLSFAGAGFAAAALMGAAILVVRGRAARRLATVTWDCGYAKPTARMQYTAGSFAATLTEWLADLLRSKRREIRPEGVFPAEAAFESHTPDVVLDEAVLPSAGRILRAASVARRLHHGRVQAYLVYVVLGLGALALLVCLGIGGKG